MMFVHEKKNFAGVQVVQYFLRCSP